MPNTTISACPQTNVPFPTVTPVIGAAPIAVTQSVDLFKLGMNYNFDLAMLTASAAKN